MKRLGSCQCGGVTYQINGEPIALGACFCTTCQKESGGISTYSMLVNKSNFELLTGALDMWSSTERSGSVFINHFCNVCHCRVYATDPDSPEIVRVKAGTLEDAKELEPEVFIWLGSAPSWVSVPEGALAYETQPSVEEILKNIYERRAKRHS